MQHLTGQYVHIKIGYHTELLIPGDTSAALLQTLSTARIVDSDWNAENCLYDTSTIGITIRPLTDPTIYGNVEEAREAAAAEKAAKARTTRLADLEEEVRTLRDRLSELSEVA